MQRFTKPYLRNSAARVRFEGCFPARGPGKLLESISEGWEATRIARQRPLLGRREAVGV